MAELTLEIIYRHQSHFHKVERPVLRIGRALDNDIILPDPSVSAYHLLLKRTAGGEYELVPLSEENGTRIDGVTIDHPIAIDQLPQTLEIGRTRIVVHDRQHPVVPARLISCRNGGPCIFGHWFPATLLFAAMVLVSGFDNYLSTHELLTWESFWSDQLVIVAIALGFTLAMVLITRITSHRWEFASCLSFVSLALILAFGIDQVTAFLDYYFTSPLPGFSLNALWAAVAIPLFTLWFLTRLHHGNFAVSVILVLITFTPGAYLQLKKAADYYGLDREFSRKSHYSHSLYPRDIRAAETMDIDQFTAVFRKQHKEKQ